MAVPSRYAYAVEVVREDDTPVGQVAVEVDWEPAREWVRLLALRQGVAPEDAFIRDCSVEPVWDDARGEPYLGGFRVRADGGAPCEQEFGVKYFRDLARKATARMIADGRLEKGDLIRCLALAFPQDTSTPGGDDGPRLGRASPPQIPLRGASLSALLDGHPVEGASHPDDPPLCIPERVLGEVKALTLGAGARETGGLLIGHLYRDAEEAQLFAEVTAQVPARHTEADASKLTFTPATWTEARAAIELRRRDEIMLGWWHSHPVREWCKECPEERRRTCALARGFLSDDDRLLHRTVFPRAYSVALVANDVGDEGPTFSLFGWRHGLLEERGFYRMKETHDDGV